MDMLESLLAQIDWVSFAGWAALLLQFSLAVGVILRVMLTRHPPGSAFAWIILTIILPYVGFALYILIGERPVGRWRAYRLKKMLARWESITNLQSEHSVELPASQRHKGLVRLAQRLGDIAMTSGSTLELLLTPTSHLRALSKMFAAPVKISIWSFTSGVRVVLPMLLPRKSCVQPDGGLTAAS